MAKAPSPKTPSTGMEETLGAMPGLFPMDRLLNGNGHGLQAWTEMNKTLLDRLGAWQAETTRFVAKRLEEDLASQRELAACRTPTEAMEVCGAFTRRAVQDYMEEAAKVGDIASAITRACAAFGESLTASTMQGATIPGQVPAPVSAAARATDDARAEIAA